jgi:hypothetical protein
MKYAGILFLLIIFGCKNEPIIYPDGGYAFINTDTIKDKSFPYFPVRDSMNSRDSMRAVLYAANFLKLFDEPNISLKPSEKEIFRLSIENSLGGPYYFITLTDGKIIAKKGLQNKIFNWETNKLSENEQTLYYLLGKYILINDKDQEDRKKPTYNTHEKRQIDSCKKIGITNCYKYLFEKSALPLSNIFKYETRIITLPNHAFNALINKINNSGYWKMPFDLECAEAATDGIFASLEANNGKKYNLVSGSECPSSFPDFYTACQQIINYAHYDDEIKIDRTSR